MIDRHRLLIALVLASLFCLLGYPGQMTYDSFYTLREARTYVEGGAYSPFNAYLWRFFDFNSRARELVWVFQTFGFVFLYSYACLKLSRSRLVLVISLSVLALPVFLGPLLTLWKDVLLAFFLLAGYFLGSSSMQNFPPLQKKILTILFILFMLMATLIKLNAILAVVPIIILVVFKKSERRTISFCKFIAIFALIIGIAIYINFYKFGSLTRLESNESYINNPHWITQAYDLIGLSKAKKIDIEYEGKLFISHACSSKIFNSKSYSLSSANLGICNTKEYSPLLTERTSEIWKIYVSQYPLDYLKVRLDFYTNLVGFFKKSHYISQFNTVDSLSVPLPSRDAGSKGSPGFYDAKTEITSVSNFIKIYLNLVAGLYINPVIFYLIAGATVGFQYYKGNGNFIALCLIISAALFILSYALITCDADIRYNMWSVTACMIAILIATKINKP